MKSLHIEYDVDYGSSKLTGWSICYDRTYLVQFEKYLIVAVIKAFKNWLSWEKKE